MWDRAKLSTCAVISLFLIALGSTIAAGKTIYVDADATGANNGSSWADACNYLQDALMMASAGDEIRVAQGIYKPDQFVLSERANLGRMETFQLKNEVAIRGGYAGFGEPYLNARDIAAYETILSGDLAGNDVDVNDPCDLQNEPGKIDPNEPTRAENSFHVVTGSGTDETSVLDGFTIKAGHALGPPYNPYDPNANLIWSQSTGGGMYNNGGSPKLSNCTFDRNFARWDGGGMCNNSGSSPTISKCSFSRNQASIGGGICNLYYCNILLYNCIFNRNSAKYGGAMSSENESNLVAINCIFSGNSATSDNPEITGLGRGGGIFSFCNDQTITNCSFIGNFADIGGDVYNESVNSTITNCTFVDNLANNAQGLYGAIYNSSFSDLFLTNSIIWGSDQEIWNNYYSIITISYSDVRGGQSAVYDPCDGLVWDSGNIDENPIFSDLDNNDYHLKSQAGRWNPFMADWVKDDVTSPCIDAGDMSSPIGHELFPNGGIINMGAYGGTAEASKSYFGEPVCETIVAGDINGDCRVDFKDFAVMALHWLEDNSGP